MTGNRELERLDADARRLLEMYQAQQYTSLLNEVDELSKRGALSAGVYGIAAMACTELERYGEAVTATALALDREPGWAWLYHARAAAEAGQRHLPEAVAAATRAVTIAPEEPSYAAALARYQRESGQVQQAVLTARQALRADGDHTGALNELGLALQASGDTAGALEQFGRAREVAPADPAAWVNEGALHLGARRLSDARRCFREALKDSPGLPAAEDRMADTLIAPPGLGRRVLHHAINLGRVTLVGWMMISFLYYVSFRVLQILWKLMPFLLPVAQGLLYITLAYLVGGFVVGRLLRWLFRGAWPN